MNTPTPTVTSQTAAQAIANHLSAAGCKHAFGMPGGEVLVVLDALTEAGINFTLCKHENAAGFMAEGSWHATGAPGLLLTTVGPGLANCLNSVANAFQEQVPLIILSGCVDASEAERFTHQVIDQSALLAPITKAQFQVAPGTASHVVQKALAIAMADPPGPVHIDLPVGLAASDAQDVALGAMTSGGHGWPNGPALQTAAEKLAAARRPIVLAGLGALLHDAGAALTRMAQERGIPVVTTYKAKGLVDETDPLCLGGHGLSPLSDTHILPLFEQSDCIILAGYDPIEMRSGWIDPWDADKAIELNHADVQHGMHGSCMRVIGDVACLVSQLHDTAADNKEPWPEHEPQTTRHALKADFFGPDRWGPHAVFRALQKHYSSDVVMTVDSGAHRILLSQMIECTRPRALLQSSCFCTMGVAVPLAIGHAIALPEAPVIAVVGDAGFDMTTGDLATLRDSGASITIVVLVDDSLALIEKKQMGMQLPSNGVLFGPTDIAAVARAYGGNGIEVCDLDTFENELEKSMKSSVFSVIACRVDKNDYRSAF